MGSGRHPDQEHSLPKTPMTSQFALSRFPWQDRSGNIAVPRRPSTILFAVVLTVGLVVRLLALRTSLAQQNSDTAVVYLMARHVTHGDIRVFYWGQFYGGTLLQLTAGMLFWLTGPSFAVLQIVEIAFWLAACLLLRSVVAHGVGPVAGDLAGCFFWVAAPFMVSFSFTDPGFVGDAIAIGLAAIRLAQARGARPGVTGCLGVGLCLGLALWTSPVALAFAVPAALWVGYRARRLIPLGAVMVGAVVGAVPWLYETEKSHFKTLQQLPGPPESPFARFVHVFTAVVPAAGGVIGGPTARAIGIVVLSTVVVATAAALWRRNATVTLLGMSGLLAAAVVVASRVPIDPTQPRYATYLLPSLAALLAWGLTRVPLAAAAAAVVLVSSWTIGTTWNSTNGLEAVPQPAIGKPIATLAARLEREGRTDVWADYWIAFMLSAATQERIVAGDLSPRREESYLIRAAQAPKTTVVLYPGRENEQALRALRGLPPHTRALVGPFAIWMFDERVDVGSYLQASY
jgi:hypothetical protein